MQLSGNAVTHQQMTFDFSALNTALKKRFHVGGEAQGTGIKIWMLVPAIQNRLKHAMGLADAGVTDETLVQGLHAEASMVHAYALGSNLKGEFFMQFGIVNQMSRGVAGSMRAIDYAKDATACTVPTNSEVLLRFTIGDPSVEREYTDDEVVEFVRGRTRKHLLDEDIDLIIDSIENKVYGRHETSSKTSFMALKKVEQRAFVSKLKDAKFWTDYAKTPDIEHAIAKFFAVVQKQRKTEYGGGSEDEKAKKSPMHLPHTLVAAPQIPLSIGGQASQTPIIDALGVGSTASRRVRGVAKSNATAPTNANNVISQEGKGDTTDHNVEKTT
jgi:hypothetical protein